MYDPNQNTTTNMQLIVEDDNVKYNKYSRSQERIIKDAVEIVNYYVNYIKKS